MHANIRAFLAEVQGLPVGVIGDVMLDRYLFGTVGRISPEAPVPVHVVTRMESRLGGAGNVAANLAQLGAHVYLYSAVGDDEAGRTVGDLLLRLPAASNRMVTDSNRQTTAKMRIVGGQQQMLRVDFEQYTELSSVGTDDLLQQLETDLRAGLRGVVISDYDKGVCCAALCRGVVDLCRQYQVPVVVDPKGTAWEKYAGAELITPNLVELSLVSGRSVPNQDADVIAAAMESARRYGLRQLAVTRSEQGISLVTENGKASHHPATAREVFDVSGAGDTVCAILTAACALRIPTPVALDLANRAAGVVVGKVGTYPITRADMESLDSRTEAGNKIYASASALAAQIRAWQAQGETVVFTNGCFDILHRGHVNYLQAAARLGNRLVVGLNSDASVRRLKGETRPICREADRAYLLQALSCVDAVIVFAEDTPYELLARLRPNLLVKGGDYRPEDIIGKEFVERVTVLPFVEGYSTTGLIARIEEIGTEREHDA